jgi:hypothetical protein
MRTIKNLILAIVLTTVAVSCRKPAEPTPEQVAKGVWQVENVIANQQELPQEAYLVDSKLHLDRNETYLFINVNGRASAGKWTSTDTKLTLTDDNGTATEYTIANITADKMHISTNFETFLGNKVELRYLLRRTEN